jgi:phenylpropionate dioxygenase-like ring-hydroxylating dioxygenase large terminal subunit
MESPMNAPANAAAKIPARYLTNTWYVAALSTEVNAQALFHRKILDTSVMIYRLADGSPVALHDRCPHRFAPLHMGKREGDEVACFYHALRFNSGGACTHNPCEAHRPGSAATRLPRREEDIDIGAIHAAVLVGVRIAVTRFPARKEGRHIVTINAAITRA